MKLHEINPYVRFCALQKCFGNSYFGGSNYLMAYDSRLLYCLSGSGMIEIENNMYEMKKDSLIIFRFGLKYKYHHNERKDMECISINFDYNFSGADNFNSRIPPDMPSKFDSERIIYTPYLCDVIYIKNALEVKSELLKIYSLYNESETTRKEELGARLKLLITMGYYIYLKEQTDEQSNTKDLVKKICKYIDENSEVISDGKDVSEIFSYHSYYINRLFKKYLGITLHKYILKAKISRSVDYLTTTNMAINEIAYKCGFFDTSHYSRNFKKITGYTPSKYRYI